MELTAKELAEALEKLGDLPVRVVLETGPEPVTVREGLDFQGIETAWLFPCGTLPGEEVAGYDER